MGICVFCRREAVNLMCDDCASNMSDLRYTVPHWHPGWYWAALKQNKLRRIGT